jgi:hypothetical protein
MDAEDRRAVAMIRSGDDAVMAQRDDAGAKVDHGEDDGGRQLVEGRQRGLGAAAGVGARLGLGGGGGAVVPGEGR